jgi:dual specificity MAP kinase phosphatase
MSASYEDPGNTPIVSMRRPRASTSPLLPSLVDDHQVWFDDPRFDGSFPSRVLPFLYLGNLCVSPLRSYISLLMSGQRRRNHAANAYMLHALGITHVVSVGECALIPPPTDSAPGMAIAPSATKIPSPATASGGSDQRGSLFIEEREGRIKVLDIKGVCDDGIDTLEPQLAPICNWIDRAREQGGKVLVHCRVGVSRSATVTIAYVMKYLGITLIEAYLIVRSRRLSVLIQPNMRLLYNLCGWEVKLAHERAAGDTERLHRELARCSNWPYLAREVHLLNEKYLHA